MFSLHNTILHSLFPYQCVGCTRYDTVLCSTCALGALYSEHIVLPAPSPIQSITTVGEYKHPVWKTAVKKLKFSHTQALAVPLGQLIAGVVSTHLSFSDSSAPVIVPIPLHRRRMRERGYNQTELIAHAINDITGWPVVTGSMQRLIYSSPQSSLDHSLREQNIAGVYTLSAQAFALRHRTILLLDDVITSGATILEAARVLQKIESTQIHAIAVARGG